jgi:phosphonate transport system substrate-binding protein
MLGKNCKLFIVAMVIVASQGMGVKALRAQSVDGPVSYQLGVFPYLPPRVLESVFAPIAVDMSNVLNKEILFRTSSTYSQFVENIEAQKYDVAFVQPFDYVRTARQNNYVPLATRDEPLEAIIVTLPGSSIKTAQDMKGAILSLPPASSAVSHLVKVFLAENKLRIGTDIQISHTRSHLSCMHQVLVGDADACGTAAPPLRVFEAKMQTEMKVMTKTASIPHTLFVVHSRVNDADRNALLKRILSWSETEHGKKILQQGKFKPFKAINDSDYDIVRRYLKMAE